MELSKNVLIYVDTGSDDDQQYLCYNTTVSGYHHPSLLTIVTLYFFSSVVAGDHFNIYSIYILINNFIFISLFTS